MKHPDCTCTEGYGCWNCRDAYQIEVTAVNVAPATMRIDYIYEDIPDSCDGLLHWDLRYYLAWLWLIAAIFYCYWLLNDELAKREAEHVCAQQVGVVCR